MDVVVTGVGLALAGVDDVRDLIHGPRPDAGPFDPGARLGHRGLRYRDRASQLALSAAYDALTDGGLLGREPLDGARIAVVASSNLGNLDTVCRAADVIANEGSTGLSPMDLPNASSNVVASSVALRFGLRGPNLMLCNGPTSGLDAVHWAASLLAAGRCAQALVVGVEPRNTIVASLTGLAQEALLDGAAALLLEDQAAASARGAKPAAQLGRHLRSGAGAQECVARVIEGCDPAPAAWFTPGAASRPAEFTAPAGVSHYALEHTFGQASGALGVLHCAAAIGWLAAGSGDTALIVDGGDADDAVTAMLLHQPARTEEMERER